MNPLDPKSDLGEQSPEAVRLAAGEFSKYWRLATGRDLPDESPARALFRIDPALDAAHDEYRIRSLPDGIEFAGANGRSVFYAVYDFLSRRAGCRWFWDGDVVPHRDVIRLDGLDVREKSRFEYRAIRYFAHRGLTRFQAEHWGLDDWKREIDWCLKSRLNCFMPRIGMDDTWQKAFPDIVGYPDPAEPADGGLAGYDNRVPFWGLEYRGELRKAFTDYAFARGLMIPTDFGTMTHWYSRTPDAFLEAKNPPFLPQANNNYRERSGLVWDVFQGEWADDYIHLTEAFIDAGYGRADLLHTIGLGERMCYDDRGKNLDIKKRVLALMTRKALEKHPDAKILLAGWDFYITWRPEEVQSLLAELDPAKTIIWDYESEIAKGVDPWLCKSDSNFTNWGVVGKFPYTFGIFLAYESALDIRARYASIEEREKIAANDPFCKGYILWPESSHTDTFLLRYFTENAWRPGKPHESLLPGFCRDRYGAAAPAFEPVWRAILPVSQLLGWGENWGSLLLKWTFFKGVDFDAFRHTLSAVPGIFDALAALEPEGDFQWRDAIDLARTAADRTAIWTVQLLFQAFAAWRDGTGTPEDVERRCADLVALAESLAEILALHTDYSLCESLDRLAAVAPLRAPDFDKVLLDNASCAYCRSHQYEVAVGCYVPFARDLVREIERHLASGDRSMISAEWAKAAPQKRLAELAAKGIEAYRPRTPRTVENYRRTMAAVRDLCSAALA